MVFYRTIILLYIMDLARYIFIHASVLLVVLSCGVSNSDPEPIQNLNKEIIGHWESNKSSIHFEENGTFQDTTFRQIEELFTGNTCEVTENDTEVPIIVISGNYLIKKETLEFSSITVSLSCNPDPVVHRIFPYDNKVISISNDSLTLKPTRLYRRESVSDTGLFGTWKSVNKGLIYSYELPTGSGFGDITEKMIITNHSYSSIFYDTILPDDSIKYESLYFYDPPEFINSCCTFPIIYLVDINGNEMEWVDQSQDIVYINTKN